MLKTFIKTFARWILSLRYKIEVKGLEKVNELKDQGGVLFLPNHPSELDPVILYTLLDGKIPLIPLVADNIFSVPVIGFLLKDLGALPIPNVDTGGNEYIKNKAFKAIKESANVLKEKKNLLVYPAGGLKREAFEDLGAVVGIRQIINEVPNAPIVLIRTTGLWGSSFSRALTNSSPDLGKQILCGFWMVLKNGIFFLPKRKVTIELEEAKKPLPEDKLAFNRALEKWYNAPFDEKGEPLNLVPEQFWSKRLPLVQNGTIKKKIDIEQIPKENQQLILQEISKISKHAVNQISPEDDLARDLGMDSLDVVALIAFLDQEFNVKSLQPDDLQTVLDAMAASIAPKENEDSETKRKSWKKERNRPLISFAKGKSLQEVFLNSCDQFSSFEAMADQSGSLTYSQLKMRALLLADKFKQIPTVNVGVMLPATNAAMVVVFALLLAKKLPVMLNWTVGSKGLREIVKVSQMAAVITSEKFLSQAKTMDVEGIESLFFRLEDLRSKITLKDKFKALLLSKSSAKSLLKRLSLDKIDEDKPVALLFTSGTESMPKGVPLSHKNILCNQRAALECANFKETDVLFSFLPPFHSFGFIITGMLPLLCGLKVLYSPDPTDGVTLARMIEQWKVSILCAAPTFLREILRSSKENQLKSVRLVVSGAEKAPKALFEDFKNCGVQEILEGYGITECSPILTLTRQNDVKNGVGKPLPGIQIKIIDLESHIECPIKKEGLIIARGPNVFNGYLQDSIPSPFIEFEGKRWYNTGDLGFLDETGSLILSGRLKRFVKVGGEMINLSGIEEALNQKWPNHDKGASLALCAKEKEGERPQLILFTTFDCDIVEINQYLQQSGYSGLVKVSKINKVEEIPLLGTGKTNYRALESNFL